MNSCKFVTNCAINCENMKAVLFIILALFVWITSVSAQITREMGDEFVMDYLKKNGVQPGFLYVNIHSLSCLICNPAIAHAHNCGISNSAGMQAGIDMAKYLYRPVARNGIS